MKFSLIVFAYFITCISCKKTTEPITVPIDSVAERDISLAYVNSVSETNQFEIIVTDSAANFLLDTIVSTNTMHYLKVHSNATLFNITTIDLQESTGFKSVQTFYQVNPIEWKINQQFNIGFSDSTSEASRVDGELFYRNLPPGSHAGNFQYGDGYSASYDGINKTITVGYKATLPYNSYILFPTPGLCKIYQTSKVKDTIDLTVMDAAVAKLFKKAMAVKTGLVTVTGYIKKDDNSSAVRLWTPPFNPTLPTYDFMYPASGIAQYRVQYIAIDNSQNSHYTELFGDAIPDSINFIDNSWYSVINSDINDFKISFSNSKPSVYSLDFVVNKLYWGIYLPTGKNALKGTREIVDLSKSIRLKGQDFSSIQYNRIGIQNGDDLNYSDYYNFVFDKNAYGKNKFSVYMSY